MKKLFTIALFLFISIGTSAQLLDDGNSWNVSLNDWGFSSNRTYKINGDTIINGHFYKKMYLDWDSTFTDSTAFYIAALRMDSNKVKMIEDWQPTEYTIYDFNLELGDTMVIFNPQSPQPTNDWIVLDIDSVNLYGSDYKRWTIGYPDPWDTTVTHVRDVWIEHIGSMNGILAVGFNAFDASFTLKCFHRDSIKILGGDRCGVDVTVSTKQIEEVGSIQVFPNPANDYVNIKIENLIEVNSFSIFNLLGQELGYFENVKVTSQIDVSQYPRVFFVVLKTPRGLITKKILKY